MARTAIPIQKLTRGTTQAGGTLAAPSGAGIAVDANASPNGMVVSPKKAHKMLIVVYAGSGTPTMTVAAGAYPPAESQGVGAFVTAALTTVAFHFFVLESARHLQANGDIWINFDTGTAAVIWAVEMPA